MALLAGFNQPEATASFRAALTFDATCAMCYWGLAYAKAPFQNKPAVPQPKFYPDVYPRYTQADMRAAAAAIRKAAVLVGLVRQSEAEEAARAAAAALRVQMAAVGAGGGGRGEGGDGAGDSAAGATAGGAGTGEAAGLRLMEQLRLCRPSWGSGQGVVGGGSVGAFAEEMQGVLLRQNATGGGSGGVEGGLSDDVDLLTRERHYIAAMFDRLSPNATFGDEWEWAERRYAQDMADMAACWLDDAAAPALAAEALGNLNPWDFWDPVTGEPRAVTPLALALLNESLARDPAQPLALHLHIHMTEELPAGRGAARAGVAEPSADALLGLLPRLDHLQHMPSHNYVRVGRWADAVQSNIASLRAANLGSHCCLASLYPDHNAAMAVFAAGMAADGARAEVYARLLKELPRFVHDAPASVGLQWGAPLPVWVRFAQWRNVLATPPPPVPGPGGAPIAWAGPPPEPAAAAAHALPDLLSSSMLDPLLREARPAPAEGGPGGAGPLRGPLADTEYTQDGAEFARVQWHFARVMALAGQLAAASPAPANASALPAAASPHLPRPAPTAAAAAASLGTHLSAAALATLQHLEDAAATTASPTASPTAAPAAASPTAGPHRRELTAEFAALRAAVSAVPPDVYVPPGQGMGVMLPGYGLLAALLGLTAEGRLAALAGDWGGAAGALGAAAAVEGGGGYYEPPRTGHQPARQCLGWVLLREGRLREALQTYLDDLSEYPDNPWSLRGLHTALPPARQALAALQQHAAEGGEEGAGGGSGGGTGGAAAARRQQAEALQRAVAAAEGAAAAASEAAKQAAGMLRSSCLAFSEHHS